MEFYLDNDGTYHSLLVRHYNALRSVLRKALQSISDPGGCGGGATGEGKEIDD